MPVLQRKTLTFILCNATLEVVHSHLVRAARQDDPGDWVLVYPTWVSDRAVSPEMWTKVLAVGDTRPEYGGVIRKIRRNLAILEESVAFDSYCRIDLVVSDLFWLMNNVLAAKLARFCRSQRIEFNVSLLDEGAVLYSGTRLGLRRSLRSAMKYVYLRLHGLPSLLIQAGNADYLHPLCNRVFCLHPELLELPNHVESVRIDTSPLRQIYQDRVPTLDFPSGSCLYLSQPLYKLVGVKCQLALVRSFRERLSRQGIAHFYYKPHHADLPFWSELLETECGLRPLEFQEMVPIEMAASCCNAKVILSHTTSALMNLKRYGYHGRLIAYGLDQLQKSFREPSQYDDFVRALETLGVVEFINADEPKNHQQFSFQKLPPLL